jgi:hypothetical protein
MFLIGYSTESSAPHPLQADTTPVESIPRTTCNTTGRTSQITAYVSSVLMYNQSITHHGDKKRARHRRYRICGIRHR